MSNILHFKQVKANILGLPWKVSLISPTSCTKPRAKIPQIVLTVFAMFFRNVVGNFFISTSYIFLKILTDVTNDHMNKGLLINDISSFWTFLNPSSPVL